LDFVKVSKGFAFKRVCKKLQIKHSDYEGQSFEFIKNRLRYDVKKTDMNLQQLLSQKYEACFKPFQIHNSYEEWMKNNEASAFKNFDEFEKLMRVAEQKISISLILHIKKSSEQLLRRSIASVLEQSYPYWELCIAVDEPLISSMENLLKKLAASDPRIRLVLSPAGNVENTALYMATGDYLALLCQEDELARHAFLAVALAVVQNTEARIIYSDEDKIDEKGTRSHPHFKSDWNPDLLLSHNYISHLCVFEKKLILTIGGFREELEEEREYDLLLRAVFRVKTEQVVHIPQILYHKRIRKLSIVSAASGSNHAHATTAGIKALQDCLDKRQQACLILQGKTPKTYRITWPIPDPAPLVSLLIPTRDGYALLSRCITSILEKTTYPNYEILILDNQTRDPKTLRYLRSLRNIKNLRAVKYDHHFNYSAINNFGVRRAKGSIIGLINNDIEVIASEWLTEMVSHVVRPEIGCVGAKLYYGNDTIQHAGVITGLGGVAGHSHRYYPKDAPGYFQRLQVVQNLSAVTAAAMLVRRSVYEQVGGLNENDLKVAFNDVDFCLNVRQAGYRNLWTPYAELYHHESCSRGQDDTPEKKVRYKKEVEYMQKKWGPVLRNDPYYSIHLTRNLEDFSLV
jgi:GT2 family glycosyltransferase